MPAPRRVALASSPLPLRLIESGLFVVVVETHMDVTCKYAADIAAPAAPPPTVSHAESSRYMLVRNSAARDKIFPNICSEFGN